MNVEQQIEHLQSQIDMLREQCKQQPEFEYPLYMQHRYGRQVIKFTDMHEGTVVVKGITKGSETVGASSQSFVEHTNRDEWQPIAFDEERGIADKQLCECRYNSYPYVRHLRFYDAVNKRTFTAIGIRGGSDADDYRPIPYTEQPDWAIEAERTLVD